jgi:hypothetical protein
MHIENVHIHMGPSGAIGAAVLAALVAGSAQEEMRTESGILVPPSIGEYWKGQGGIYAGVGRGRNGGKDYCLILPTDPRAIFAKRMLGTYGIDVPNASSDHDGMTNTKALAGAGSELCQEILGLDIEGHKDFYLMSRTDARLCSANVPEQFEKEWYLTSTQYSAGYAWSQYFFDGGQSSFSKEFEARARACRRLFL